MKGGERKSSSTKKLTLLWFRQQSQHSLRTSPVAKTCSVLAWYCAMFGLSLSRKYGAMKDQTTQGKSARQHTRHPDIPLEARSFHQVAAMPPPFKGTIKGSVQGQTSHIPYRSTKPPIAADVLPPDRQQVRTRHAVTTEDLPDIQPHRSIPWKRCLVAAAVIMYSLYAMYTSWVNPWVTGMYNQWHYGDARVSHATILINGKQRDILGIGYKGQVEVIILPDPTDPTTRATVYIDPQPFQDTKSRLVIPQISKVNSGDTYLDILLEVEGTNGVSPVLYGKADGTFQWNTPPPVRGE